MGLPRKKDSVNKGNHSLNPDRGKQEKGSTMRTKSTIKRLNMYRNFKAKRDKKGHIIRAAPFQSAVASGTVSRVEPNRRWFGNTRVISQDALQSFKEAMKIKNPYEIMLRQTRLPVSLLDEKKVKKKADILAAEGFQDVFGKKAKRKRPRLSYEDLSSFAREAEASRHSYSKEKDSSLLRDDVGFREMTSDPHFKAGSSKRLWNELFKVLDSSDVVLYVLDARDPMGTRSKYIEQYMKKEKPNKHFIFVINKVDLVPVWITKRWKTILSSEYPTLVFYANLTKPLGKAALMSLLRQLSAFHAKDRHQISVGIIGYPNVGKSSIINALRSKKVCKVAPVAGETKVWQYVTLLKSIYLIDCPGVVYPEGDTEAEMVMKGVVRVEYLQKPELYIPEILARVKPEFIQQRYGLPDFDPTCHPLSTESMTGEKVEIQASTEAVEAIEYPPNAKWPVNADLFLELVSKKTGKLLKGGEPDIIATSKRVLNDFQRGKLPYFVKPPALEADESASEANTTSKLDAPPEEEALEQAFTDALGAEPENENEAENSGDDNPKEEEEEEGSGIDLAPNAEDEAEIRAKEEQAKAANSGLSASRQRQLERALRRKAGRAGRHYYEEVNVKNKHRTFKGAKKTK
uniref:Nucleolar GTP-binding protein 2 n=2 Tax=Mesocestoides corti TaxID=53468 RepID=A0A5K3F9T0_MESCO